jgi:hypothetical protein
LLSVFYRPLLAFRGTYTAAVGSTVEKLRRRCELQCHARRRTLAHIGGAGRADVIFTTRWRLRHAGLLINDGVGDPGVQKNVKKLPREAGIGGRLLTKFSAFTSLISRLPSTANNQS